MSISFEIVVFLVLLALAFDFLNGFHDAANSIATIVSTGAMSPHWAVAWAAFFNFVAFLVFGFAVATTIGKGIVDPAIVDHYVVFGALCGAIAWNLVTWYYGIPSSSSHALVGGIIGAGVAKAGVGKLVASGVLKTAAAIVLSPLLGFMLAIALMIAVSWVFARSTPRRVDRWFQRLQFVSAALYSLGHGGNDAQKTMGIIWMLLIASGLSAANEPLPFWVVLTCQAAMGLGTLKKAVARLRSEEHTSELQSQSNLVCRLLLEKTKKTNHHLPTGARRRGIFRVKCRERTEGETRNARACAHRHRGRAALAGRPARAQSR